MGVGGVRVRDFQRSMCVAFCGHHPGIVLAVDWSPPVSIVSGTY